MYENQKRILTRILKLILTFKAVYSKLSFAVEPSFCHARGRFHETHRNLQLIVALTMYYSLMVLAMDFVSYDGLSSSRFHEKVRNLRNYKC